MAIASYPDCVARACSHTRAATSIIRAPRPVAGCVFDFVNQATADGATNLSGALAATVKAALVPANVLTQPRADVIFAVT
jgi:hypothetical protein